MGEYTDDIAAHGRESPLLNVLFYPAIGFALVRAGILAIAAIKAAFGECPSEPECNVDACGDYADPQPPPRWLISLRSLAIVLIAILMVGLVILALTEPDDSRRWRPPYLTPARVAA